jgi:peptidoglycan/xylan/chitin deacetylase (PgdA/CDA1 family)
MIRVAMPRRALGLQMIAAVLCAVAGPFGGLVAAQGDVALRPQVSVPSPPLVQVLDGFRPATAFTLQSTAGNAVADEADVVRGDASLRVTSDGMASQTNLRASAVGPFDLTDAHLRLVLKVDRVDLLEHVLVYLSSDGFAAFETYRVLRGAGDDERFVRGGEWVAVTVPLGTPLSRFGPRRVDLRRVTDLQLSVADVGAGPVTVHLGALDAVARPSRGVVSVVFDDARDGVYRLARPLFERAGLRATVAVISELLGTPGFMTLEELTRLERFGDWIAIAHHDTALSDGDGFDRLDEAALRAELEGVKSWMLRHGFHRGADHVAYPFGAFDAGTLAVVRAYFASGRTIVRGHGFETLPPGDPYRIRALSVHRGDAPEALVAAIDRAARERSWLVLVFHQVVDGEPLHETEYAVGDLAVLVQHLAVADVDVLPLPEALGW